MLDRMIESGKPIIPFAKLIGFSVKSAQIGQAAIKIEMREHHVNTIGKHHGGILHYRQYRHGRCFCNHAGGGGS